MSEKTKRAKELHDRGVNCAQATACVFAEEMGMSEEAVFKLMEGFGFGMGCMHTCGAVSGMVAAAGMIKSDGNIDKPATKKETYKISKQLINEFLEKNGSVICKDIKGVETGVVLRSCMGCIEDAIEIVERFIAEN